MTRTQRIAAMLVRLQAGGLVRARDLAEDFGISLRSVYRDMAALQDTGVPLLAEAGLGYRLMDGYTLPPLKLDDAELSALMLAGKLLGQRPDLVGVEALRSALAKIMAVQSEADRDAVALSADRVHVFPASSDHNRPGLTEGLLQSVIGSLKTGAVVTILYRGQGQSAAESRTVEPVDLVYTDSAWQVVAWCRLRQAFRQFRLDCIECWTETGETKLVAAWESVRGMRANSRLPQIPLRVRFRDPATAIPFRDRAGLGWISESPAPDGAGIILGFLMEYPQALIERLAGIQGAELLDDQTLLT